MNKLQVREIFQHVHVSADECCVKLPLRGVCGKLRLPGGGEAAADSPAGRIQTPRSGSFHLVMSADTAAKKFAGGERETIHLFNYTATKVKLFLIFNASRLRQIFRIRYDMMDSDKHMTIAYG
jgi:hypothetical protein